MPDEVEVEFEKELEETTSQSSDSVNYKELYFKKEKENNDFLQRIDVIIAEQEEELNKLVQDTKAKEQRIKEVEEALEEAKREIAEKNSRIATIAEEKDEEMEELRQKMKKLKKQWENDVMQQVKQLEENWKKELESSTNMNSQMKGSYEQKITTLESALSSIELTNTHLNK